MMAEDVAQIKRPQTPDEAAALVTQLREEGLLTADVLARELAAIQEQTGEALLKTTAISKTSLPPEQAEVLISTLQARFKRNHKLHEGIQWSDVERALRAQPELLASLSKMEETGGEPDVLTDAGDAFIFGDFSAEAPLGRRNVVFDQAAENWLRDNGLKEIYNGNAADRASEWGVEFMSEDEYRLLQRLLTVDQETWNWLRTSAHVGEAGHAISGARSGGGVYVGEGPAVCHYDRMAFRCSLRVPKA